MRTRALFTQAVAAWAHENGYHGIVYASRFGASFECRAIFDSASIELVGPVVPLSLDDTDLQAVARSCRRGCTVPGTVSLAYLNTHSA
jgi:hypothetical protein